MIEWLAIAAIIWLLLIASLFSIVFIYMMNNDAKEKWHREKDKAIEARKRSAEP
jgi:hypothetical protein